MKRVVIQPSFDSFRAAARPLLAASIPPEQILWDDGHSTFLAFAESAAAMPVPKRVSLPRRFVEMARRVAAHRHPERWSLLYRVAFRLNHENGRLLDVYIDGDVHQLFDLDQQVRRDIHKMHAFVRFRLVDGVYLSWYRPDHRILELAAPFFVDRFRTMRWSIMTPDHSAHWNGEELVMGPGVARIDVATSDELESLWRTYYASMFNPARSNLRKMRADMPTRFWKEMPELRDVPSLLAAAEQRVGTMLKGHHLAITAQPFLPAERDLPALRTAAAQCQGCPLYDRATQTVFGEGDPAARLMMIGEQPGHQEDLRGRPFVGPAGEVLERALREAGVDRSSIYLTNAVKHFAWIERGKQRIHRTPRQIEIHACRPWLEAEIEAIAPAALICLGATAARAIMGPAFRVTRDRGQWHRSKSGLPVLATIHPSAVLRVDPEAREQYYRMLVDDLRMAADWLRTQPRADEEERVSITRAP